MWYSALKDVHVATVVITAVLFSLRFVCRLAGRPLCGTFWRVGPHVNDTLLLASALTMTVLSGQYPFVQPWLTAKVLLLIAYIVFGTYAVKRARSLPGIAISGMAALLALAAIATSALTRRPPFWGI